MATITNGDHGDASSSNESAYVKELQKNMRNITKKLASTHKTDSVIAENPGVSLDDLVAQRKINADQKASVLKKPQLQAQLAQLEEQVQQYRKVEGEYQKLLTKQKAELEAKHAEELEKIKGEATSQERTSSESTIRSKLLLFSQFLRAAAAKRADEENAESEENKAFEGALLLVYGGDQAAVEAAIKIIEGSNESAPSIDGTATGVTYAQIKKASVDHSPFQHEEAWVDSVAEARSTIAPSGSDPTITNAGLTELEAGQTPAPLKAPDGAVSQPLSADTSNAAGERWDSNPTTGGADSTAALEESYEVIPRPNEEVDIPAAAAVDVGSAPAGLTDAALDTQASTSWADQVPAYEHIPAAAAAAAAAGDGFQEVPGRTRGGRGRGGFHRGDGEHRGRGRGGRGGRGGFGGRGRGGDGEHRGRGGRGRGHRGDGPPRG